MGDPLEGKLDNQHLYQAAYAELDEEIGWQDFALRNYDAQIGRWVQQDPYQEYPSPYTGMGADPANDVDPSGGSLVGAAWSSLGGAAIGGIIGFFTSPPGDRVRNALNGAAIGAGAGMIGYAGFSKVPWDVVGNAFTDTRNWISEQRWFWQGIKTIDVVVNELVWPAVYQTHVEGIKRNPQLIQPDKSVLLTYDSDKNRNRQRRSAARTANKIISGTYDGEEFHGDEFPYASTTDGGSKAYMHLVPAWQNLAHGGYLGGLVKMNKMKSGDRFNIILVPNKNKPVLVPDPIPLPFGSPKIEIPKFSRPALRPAPLPMRIPLRIPIFFPWGELFEKIFSPPDYHRKMEL